MYPSHEESLAVYNITLPYLVYLFGGLVFFLWIVPNLGTSFKYENLFLIWFVGQFIFPAVLKLITFKKERRLI